MGYRIVKMLDEQHTVRVTVPNLVFFFFSFKDSLSHIVWKVPTWQNSLLWWPDLFLF